MSEMIKKYVLGPNNVFVPISVLGAIFVFFTGSMVMVSKSVWELSKSVAEFQMSIDKRFDCMDRRLDSAVQAFQRHTANEWGRANMEKWTYLLEKSNRNLNLTVPDPSLAKIGAATQ